MWQRALHLCVDVCVHVWTYVTYGKVMHSSKVGQLMQKAATYCTSQAARVATGNTLVCVCVYACVNVCHVSYNHAQLEVGQLTAPDAPHLFKIA